MAISLGKAILAGLAGGADALATSFEKEDERRLEFTKEGVAAAVKNRAEARKRSLEQTKENQEFEDKVDSVAGLGIQLPDENGNLRALSRSDVGALLQVFEPDDLIKFAEEKNLTVSGQAKRIESQGTTMGGFDAEMAEVIPEGESFISKGRQASVQEKISQELKSRGYNPEGVTIPGAVKYAGLKIDVKGGGTVKRDADYTFSAELNGELVDNVRGFVGDDGFYYINDPRFIEDELIRATKDKFSNPVPAVRKVVTGDDNLTDAIEFVTKRIEDSSYDKLRSQLVQQSASTKTLGQDLERMWEIAQDIEVYSGTVLALGSITKTLKREFAGVTFVFNPEDDSAESRQKNAESLGQLREFIENNQGAEDVVVRRKVLDAMIFEAAMKQATDGQSNPSDKDLQGMLQQFQAGDPKEFFQKAQQTWAKRTASLKNSYNAYINNNPLSMIDFSSMPPEYSQARDIVLSGKTIREEDVNLNAPLFLQTTDPEELPDSEDVQNEFPDILPKGKKTEEQPVVPFTIQGMPDVSEATYDPATDEFVININGKEARISSEKALQNNNISLEELKKLKEGQ